MCSLSALIAWDNNYVDFARMLRHCIRQMQKLQIYRSRSGSALKMKTKTGEPRILHRIRLPAHEFAFSRVSCGMRDVSQGLRRAPILHFAQGFAGTSDLASLDCQHTRTTIGLKASNFRCTLGLHRVASAFSPPQLFAYHILQPQIGGGPCTRLLCCIVQIFRFSFCRSQHTDFACHQSTMHNSSTGIA